MYRLYLEYDPARSGTLGLTELAKYVAPRDSNLSPGSNPSPHTRNSNLSAHTPFNTLQAPVPRVPPAPLLIITPSPNSYNHTADSCATWPTCTPTSSTRRCCSATDSSR